MPVTILHLYQIVNICSEKRNQKITCQAQIQPVTSSPNDSTDQNINCYWWFRAYCIVYFSSPQWNYVKSSGMLILRSENELSRPWLIKEFLSFLTKLGLSSSLQIHFDLWKKILFRRLRIVTIKLCRGKTYRRMGP